MLSHHPAKFGGHRHCGSGDRMLLVVAEDDSRCYCFNPPLLFISKDMGCKHSAYHINNYDLGHTHSKKQLDKNLKITFASLSKNTVEKRRENNGNCKTFCVTRKRNKEKHSFLSDTISVSQL